MLKNILYLLTRPCSQIGLEHFCEAFLLIVHIKLEPHHCFKHNLNKNLLECIIVFIDEDRNLTGTTDTLV